MKKPDLISFLYHDIASAGSSLKPYSIDEVDFEKQVSALTSFKKTVLVPGTGQYPYTFTFDDGNKSAIHVAATILEKYGAKGHFFIITSAIGKPGYLDEDDIKELHRRGHIIGSHSHSHDPLRNTDPNEWLESVGVLSKITGEKIRTASVPGGWYSKKVAIAAGKAGIEWLFTSEPKVHLQQIGDCTVAGRFSVTNHTTVRELLGILNNKFPWRERQWLYWNMKKASKMLGPKTYLKVRENFINK